MGQLRALSVSQQVGLLFVVLFGLLGLVTLIAFSRSFRDVSPEQAAMRERFARELRALWLGAILFWVAWASGPLGSTLLFGFVSFFALREFVTLTQTRRADHRALLLAFFVILPMQYVLVGMRLINAFTVFIPVYLFFAIPVISALANDPFRFLERTAKIQWGITVTRLRPEPRAGAAPARPAELPRARRLPGPLPRPRRRRRPARPGIREPAPAPAAGRARDQPLVLVARLRRRRRRGRRRRRAALLGDAVQAARRRWRWARSPARPARSASS